jgi:uncharacterized membrane protein
MAAERPGAEASGGRPKLPGILLGLGLGGFIDGIVLHQLLQWHHMLTAEGCCSSATVVGLEDNTLADGLFLLVTWVAVALGTGLTVRAWQRGRLAPPWSLQIGLLLAGWGLFNLVEGVTDHHLLGVHHVRDDVGAPLGWDLGFLGFGTVLLAIGLVLVRRAGSLTGVR